MKNIIVPTDFSVNANNALRFAINIANHFESVIHLIHIYNVPRNNVPSNAEMMRSIKDLMVKDTEEELEKIMLDNKDRLFNKTKMEAKAMEGYIDTIMTTYAKAINADLIIMGTQGASGLTSVFLGSNATAVIESSEVPVLVIPSDCEYQPLKDITLAVDHEEVSNGAVFSPLLDLAKAYKSHISVLHVDKELVGNSVDVGIGLFLIGVAHSFRTVYESDTKRGIDNFVKRIDANLLCMIHRERSAFGNLFHKSVVNKEAFNSPAPLLVLYDNHRGF